ncbi:MAG: YlmC/YmxH family sporulation protein [Clostridiaceae bacterium]
MFNRNAYDDRESYEDIRLYSEIERYEIINVYDGEHYSSLSNNDILIDDDGNLKILLLNETTSRLSFFSKNGYKEIPWDCVRKIGSKTIIIDADENEVNYTNL